MKKIVLCVVAMLFVFQGASAKALKGDEVKIKITFNDNFIVAKLNDSASAKDLLQKLPMTLKMHNHQNREYYANIRLDKNSQTQNGYQIGDIAYWAPGDSLVLFYGKGYTNNLMIIGEMISGLELLPKMGDVFSAYLEIME